MPLRIRVDHYHHVINDERIEKKLDKLLELAFINKSKIETIMTDLTEITKEVTETTDAQQAAVILLDNLKQKLDSAGTDPVALKQLSDALGASTDALAAAIVANTPAA